MKKTLVLILILCVGCVRNQRDLARYVDTTLLVTSTVTIACDWGYTNRAAQRDWKGTYEANPVLGRMPSPGEVNAYFASMLVLNASAWLIIPPKYRAIIPLAVTFMQIPSLQLNSTTVGGFCGQ